MEALTNRCQKVQGQDRITIAVGRLLRRIVPRPSAFCHTSAGENAWERKDFMNFRLTGRMVASINNASIRWHYSTLHGWPVSLLEKLGLSDLKVGSACSSRMRARDTHSRPTA